MYVAVVAVAVLGGRGADPVATPSERPRHAKQDYIKAYKWRFMEREPKDLPSLSLVPLACSDVRENGKASEPNQTASGETGFIDEKQLLAKLPISRRTLGNWKAKGILPYIKIGRRKPSSRNAACR